MNMLRQMNEMNVCKPKSVHLVLPVHLVHQTLYTHSMRVALVHELLTINGGAERVLQILAEMFPQAPIYTLLHREQTVRELGFDGRIVPSTLQKYAGLSTNHHLYLPFFPAAVEAWSFDSAQDDIHSFDLVISSSSAFAHGIITNGKPKHISYVHSPARYLWDRFHDVQHTTRNPLARSYHSWIAHKLRVWDAEAAQRPDLTLAASTEVQRRIEMYWNVESDVLYPPIADTWFSNHKDMHDQMEHPNYFLIVSTLARYKRIEIAIEACNETQQYLKIVGTGPDMQRLKALAGPTIEFYGHRQGDELADLYANAQAVIFPGHEDFGLVPVEAMACGTPVIAFRGGGALETIKEGVTGAFFDEPTALSLTHALQSFDHKKYSIQECRTQAQKFRKDVFVQELYSKIDALMKTGAA